MTVEVNLQIRGLDLDDEATYDLIEEHLNDYVFAVVSGISVMTVFAEPKQVVQAASQAMRCARHHGIEVLRVQEDRVNADEIARRVGTVSRQAVRKWTGDVTFPTPRIGSTDGRGESYQWDWAEVLVWLYEAKGIDLDEHLPTAKQVAEVNALIAGIKDYASEAAHWRIETPDMTVHGGNVVEAFFGAGALEPLFERVDRVWTTVEQDTSAYA